MTLLVNSEADIFTFTCPILMIHLHFTTAPSIHPLFIDTFPVLLIHSHFTTAPAAAGVHWVSLWVAASLWHMLHILKTAPSPLSFPSSSNYHHHQIIIIIISSSFSSYMCQSSSSSRCDKSEAIWISGSHVLNTWYNILLLLLQYSSTTSSSTAV